MLDMATIGTRELQRFEVGRYDLVDIIDKKQGTLRGIFVGARFAQEVKTFLIEKHSEKTAKLLSFAGIIKDSSESVAQIKEQMQ